MPGLRVLLPAGLGLLLVACGSSPKTPLLDRPPFVAADAVVWAQGTTLHVGDRTFPLPGPVATVTPSTYGVVVTVKAAGGVPGQTGGPLLVTEQGATPLPGRPGPVLVSPDGRYAGWIDGVHGAQEDGLAKAVVVDLRTGATLLSDSSGMGGDRSQDELVSLYEDVSFPFLGFDESHAYWTVPEGDITRKRADLATGEVERAGRPGVDSREQQPGVASDRSGGTSLGIGEDGRPTASIFDGRTGSRSPGGRWCVVRQDLTRLPVTDCASGATVTPRYPAPEVVFGGWLGEDSYLVLASAERTKPFPPDGSDDRAAVLAVCTPPARACRTVERLASPSTVAVPTRDAVP